MKKTVLNKKGLVLYVIVFIIAITSGVYDTPNTQAYIISKIITLVSFIVLFILNKYIPSKYTEE